MLDYSILLPFYHKDRADLLFNSILSCVEAMQSASYSGELILLQDGQVGDDLTVVIGYFTAFFANIRHYIGPRNEGLASILNQGAGISNGEFLVRIDADDEMLANRLQVQIDYMKREKLDVCGSYIFERNRLGMMKEVKHYPVKHKEIINFMKQRCPFAHPSTILKRSAFDNANIYSSNFFPEDYLLWYVGYRNGLKFGNVPEYLTIMNFDNADLKRRNKKFFRGEIKIYYQMYNDGFITYINFIYLLLVRSVLRLSPFYVKLILYKYFR